LSYPINSQKRGVVVQDLDTVQKYEARGYCTRVLNRTLKRSRKNSAERILLKASWEYSSSHPSYFGNIINLETNRWSKTFKEEAALLKH
jgi:hypothetical protein